MAERLGRHLQRLLPRFGLGTAPLGGLFREVADHDAASTVRAALDRGVRLFDTAPLYGHGLAEQRLGAALGASSVPRRELVMSSKVGRVLVPGEDPTTIFHGVPPLRPRFDFSPDGVRRSLHDSLERLGLDRLDLALVHDPDDHETAAVEQAFPTLVRLREEGLVGAIGAGMNQVAMLDRFVARADDLGLDVVLLAGRWSLLDRSGAALLDRCGEAGVAVMVGGVFNSGLLADPAPGATFDYVAAPTSLVDRARRLAAVCVAHGTTLATAAVQFPLRHPTVSAVVVGARTAAEVQANIDAADVELPDELWPALDRALTNGADR